MKKCKRSGVSEMAQQALLDMQPEFGLQNQHKDRRRKAAPQRCLKTSTCMRSRKTHHVHMPNNNKLN